MTSKHVLATVLASVLGLAACGGSDQSQATVIRIPRGAGGIGFLPLLMMDKHDLVEKHARKAGIQNPQVDWIDVGGPSAMNDALLSGAVDFIAAGPPAFLVLADKTADNRKVKGVAAMTSLPMYLNVRNPKLNKLEDFTDGDTIAMTEIKVSIPAIVMQMYAAQKYGLSEATRFDRFTVSMTHADGVIALRPGSGAISGHYTSPPFAQREQKEPGVRTIMTTDDVMKGSTTFTMLSTSSTFRDKNPKVVTAVLAALDEATQMIRDDKKAAVDVLIASTKKSALTAEELLDVISDPTVKFTTTPENVMKYAEFMHSIGTLSSAPSSWKDLFFPEIHGAPGS